MSYTELTVVIDGALEFSDNFTNKGALDAKVQEYVQDPHPYGLLEIYFLDHGHPMTDEECACIQYESSHSPQIVIDKRRVDEEAP